MSEPVNNSTIVLYSTAGCHLCEEAEALLKVIADLNVLDWQICDIAEQPHLVERYGIRIPVVAAGQAELDWPFDEAVLLNFLSQHLAD